MVHYRDKNELRNRVRKRRREKGGKEVGRGGGAGDDPQQTGLMELE